MIVSYFPSGAMAALPDRQAFAAGEQAETISMPNRRFMQAAPYGGKTIPRWWLNSDQIATA